MSTVMNEENTVNQPYYIEDDEADTTAAPVEKKGDEVVDLGAKSDIQVEVEDDTPAEDQGRTPLPDDLRDDLEEDAEQYSKSVQKRINQMRKSMHDERRDKEAAQRERDEANTMAGNMYQNTQRMQSQLNQGALWAVEQARERGLLAESAAKTKLQVAIEEGDVEAQAEAQSLLGQAQQFQTQVAQMQIPVAPQPQREYAPRQASPEQAYDPAPQQAPVDTRAQAWIDKNSEWFDKDVEMTQFAMGVHQSLVNDGVSTASDDYYRRIEKRLSEVYPDKFSGGRQPSTVVAAAGRSPQGKRVVLTRSEVAVAESMGITKEEYAREKLKMGYV